MNLKKNIFFYFSDKSGVCTFVDFDKHEVVVVDGIGIC